jgi:hypothetical protein
MEPVRQDDHMGKGVAPTSNGDVRTSEEHPAT